MKSKIRISKCGTRIYFSGQAASEAFASMTKEIEKPIDYSLPPDWSEGHDCPAGNIVEDEDK